MAEELSERFSLRAREVAVGAINLAAVSSITRENKGSCRAVHVMRKVLQLKRIQRQLGESDAIFREIFIDFI
jgi:uncharacterized protein (UPF0335 family)